MPHAVRACSLRRVTVWLASPLALATLAACDRGEGDGPGRAAAVGSLDPLLDGVFVRGDVDDLVAFLRTLDCPVPADGSRGP